MLDVGGGGTCVVELQVYNDQGTWFVVDVWKGSGSVPEGHVVYLNGVGESFQGIFLRSYL